MRAQAPGPMFCWYWLADLCQAEQIAFVLGHALYMKAIHGGKAKNDKIDSKKIAQLLRGGNLPMAYVYPKGHCHAQLTVQAADAAAFGPERGTCTLCSPQS